VRVRILADAFNGSIMKGGSILKVKKDDIIDVSDEEWGVIQKDFAAWFEPLEKPKPPVEEETKVIEESPENKMISNVSKRKRIE
jgi:hypothetical protein